MLVMNDTVPALYFYSKRNAFIFNPCDLNYFFEKWEINKYNRSFYNLDLQFFAVDYDAIEFLKREPFNIYSKRICKNMKTNELITKYFKYTDCVIKQINSSTIKNAEREDIILTIEATNRTEYSEIEIPEKVLKEMNINENL